MSLFGSFVPLTQPFMDIPPEVITVLETVLEDAGMKSSDEQMDYEALKELHDRLEVIMYFEILTYLPGHHLDAFIKMNDENISRRDIDRFLQENMPDAEKVFAGAIAKFRAYYECIGARRRLHG
jgi:hypothetical protein